MTRLGLRLFVWLSLAIVSVPVTVLAVPYSGLSARQYLMKRQVKARAQRSTCTEAECGYSPCQDVSGGWNLLGTEWGCCGNYEGCCTYASFVCYLHDALCKCCDAASFCGPQCKPEPECILEKPQEKEAGGVLDKPREKDADGIVGKSQVKEAEKSQVKEADGVPDKSQVKEAEGVLDKSQGKEAEKSQEKEEDGVLDKSQVKEADGVLDKSQGKEANGNLFSDAVMSDSANDDPRVHGNNLQPKKNTTDNVDGSKFKNSTHSYPGKESKKDKGGAHEDHDSELPFSEDESDSGSGETSVHVPG